MVLLVEAILLVAFCTQNVLTQACNHGSPYRTFDGSCNNLQNPSWGMANTPYGRLLMADYGDGISSPRRSRTGVELPSARLLSLQLFNEQPIMDPRTTLVNMQFGQIVAHDMGLRADVPDPVPCCQNGRVVANPGRRCFPIPVLPNDPVLSAERIQCLDLVRTINTCDATNGNCGGRQAQQLNAATSFLDLSLVYGNSVEQNAQLRAFVGGRMRVENRNGTDWPPRHPQTGTACTLNFPSDTCYLTGDERSNITPELTILHIVFLREHNRIAQQLCKLRPLWNDEKLFQEARRINIAQYQHIVYYEWLPFFLGRDQMTQRGILAGARGGYVNDYNPTVNPTVLNSHANGAFRYFHSAILGQLSLHQESRAFAGSLNINEHMFNPTVLERSDGYSMLTRGMTTQPMGRTDLSFDPEIRHFMFRFGSRFGTDLKALDIQRSRDHGIAGYNAFRQYCGLGRATRWEDLTELRGRTMDIQLLNSLYRTVDDVDLTVAEFLERHLPGAQAGPIYHCILMEQFIRSRRGDRFFFENGNSPAAFTPQQLNEIRKASMARLLCDNSPNVAQMQSRAFQQLANDNPPKCCRAHPALDVRFW